MAITYFEQIARIRVNAGQTLFSRLLSPGGKVLRADETDGKSPSEIRALGVMVDRIRIIPELIEIPGMNVAISSRVIAIDYFQDFLAAIGKPIPAFKPEEAQKMIIMETRDRAEFYCDWLSIIKKGTVRLPTIEERAAADQLPGLQRVLLEDIPPDGTDLHAFRIVVESPSAQSFRKVIGGNDYFFGAITTGEGRVNPQSVTSGLAGSLGVKGEEYRLWQDGIKGCLNVLTEKYGAQYNLSDIPNLIEIWDLFQLFTGMSREDPKGSKFDFSKRDEFRAKLATWLKIHGLVEDEHVGALFKALSRPSTNEEIERNLLAQGQRIADLFNSTNFLERMIGYNLRIGITGSFAFGTFSAFSDIDLCWDGDLPRNVDSERLRVPTRDKGVDLFIYKKDSPVYWLTREDMETLKTKTTHLKEIYSQRIR